MACELSCLIVCKEFTGKMNSSLLPWGIFSQDSGFWAEMPKHGGLRGHKYTVRKTMQSEWRTRWLTHQAPLPLLLPASPWDPGKSFTFSVFACDGCANMQYKQFFPERGFCSYSPPQDARFGLPSLYVVPQNARCPRSQLTNKKVSSE